MNDDRAVERYSRLAIASLVLGIASFCNIVFQPLALLAIPAIIVGYAALKRIKRFEQLRGKGLAIAGMILGIILVAGTALILFLYGSGLLSYE